MVPSSRGLLDNNPSAASAGLKAPRKRTTDAEIIKYLTAGKTKHLFEAIPHNHKLNNLRNRAMVALMPLEGLRRVEICSANVEDIEETDSGVRILVHGNGKDGYIYPCIYPREDTVVCIRDYLIQ